jgi:dolichyl-phosphate-mannose-protein mannosyltransferase
VASRDRSRIRTLTTAFRLKHEVMGCYLRAGNVNLPQWGFKQIEVTCTKDNKPSDTYTWWNIEAHTNEKLPPGNPKVYKSPFLEDFIHLNIAVRSSPTPSHTNPSMLTFSLFVDVDVQQRTCPGSRQAG